jgi:cytidylate kinase
MNDRRYDPATASVAQVAHDIARRDRLDSTRSASPLTAATDAVELDTTGLDATQVVDRVMELVAERLEDT